MACFVVPCAEAVVATVATKIIQKKEKDSAVTKLNSGDAAAKASGKTPFSKKLRWLTNLLWGGSVLLAFEHVWHGEITPFFPFLTAASNPESTAEMLHEMATVGVAMAAVITVVWLGMLAVSYVIEKKADKANTVPLR